MVQGLQANTVYYIRAFAVNEIGTGYGLGYKSGGCIVTANDIASNDFSITDYSNDGFGGD